MKANMGSADRIVRLLVAILIAALFFTDVISGTIGIILLILGTVFFITSLISFCPIYAPFKFSTLKKK